MKLTSFGSYEKTLISFAPIETPPNTTCILDTIGLVAGVGKLMLYSNILRSSALISGIRKERKVYNMQDTTLVNCHHRIVSYFFILEHQSSWIVFRLKTFMTRINF